MFNNKRNLEDRNNASGVISKISVIEALTTKRVKLFNKTRQLYKYKRIKNCWTYDGRIYVSTSDDTKTVLINSEADLTQFLNIRIQSENGQSSVVPPSQSLNLNASAAAFKPSLYSNVVTSTPTSASRARPTSRGTEDNG